MTNNFISLHCHSHYSLLDGLSQMDQIVDRLDQLECDAMALTDHGTVSGAVEFTAAMKKAGKKSILGCELYLCKEKVINKTKVNRDLSHQVVLAKNKKGWKDLIGLVSESNHPDNFYYKPRVDLTILQKYSSRGNFISFSGHLGSTIAKAITFDDKIIPDWEPVGTEWAYALQDMFGKGNFFLEVQLIDSKLNVQARLMGEIIREISRKTKIPCVATPDAHYAFPNQADDQRILLAANMRTTLAKAAASIKNTFFKSDQYFIPGYNDVKDLNTEEEIAATQHISDMCEDYDILNKPALPPFPTPNGLSPHKYLRQICAEGWKKYLGEIPKESDEFKSYGERIEYEMKVLEEANLASYFLIFHDICNYVRDQGWMLGPGRGSAAGCMVSYLSGITSINPITYDLIFERFYNAGRNTKDRVALPDIDLDVPRAKRNDVIDYIKKKYGEDKVAQIITFQSMKGRGALKRVLGAHGGMSFDEQNAITDCIEDEAKIAGDLEEMDDASIIGWALEHKADKLKEWCVLQKNGKLKGPEASKFAQAIRLEGTKTAQSRHPAGVVISPNPVSEVCPLVLDNEAKALCAGFDGPSCEDIGLVKLDILGIATLDKVMTIQELLNESQ